MTGAVGQAEARWHGTGPTQHLVTTSIGDRRPLVDVVWSVAGDVPLRPGSPSTSRRLAVLVFSSRPRALVRGRGLVFVVGEGSAVSPSIFAPRRTTHHPQRDRVPPPVQRLRTPLRTIRRRGRDARHRHGDSSGPCCGESGSRMDGDDRGRRPDRPGGGRRARCPSNSVGSPRHVRPAAAARRRPRRAPGRRENLGALLGVAAVLCSSVAAFVIVATATCGARAWAACVAPRPPVRGVRAPDAEVHPGPPNRVVALGLRLIDVDHSLAAQRDHATPARWP